MAKVFAYSVFDSKVNVFDRPMFMRSRGEALRSWQEAANDKETAISRHPEDFCLFEVGEFDPDSGKFSTVSPPFSLGLAVQFVKPSEASAPTLPFPKSASSN